MFALHTVKTKKSAIRQRQNEIVARLSAFNLKNGLRILRANDTAETFGQRLRSELESLGSTFAAFGFYLSSRVDLLPADICLELAAIADGFTPLTFTAVRQIYSDETSRELEEDFLYVTEEPFETRFFYQKHKAWLPDDAQVIVKIVNSESENRFATDEEFLQMLAPAFTRFMSEKIFTQSVEDFRRITARQFDLEREAQDLILANHDNTEFSMLCVPRIHKEFSGGKVLTLEQLSGTSLADLLADGAAAGVGGHSPEANETARLLCSVWLQQTLYGQTFPIVAEAANVILTNDKRIAFTDCSMATLQPETQLNLRRYLSAAAKEQTDRAADFWFRELSVGGKSDENKLRQQLRQIVLFRDSDWYRQGRRGQTLNLLLMQWRTATENGFVPQPHLPAFYRGLFNVVSLAERLAPDGNPLIEGLEDARLLANVADFKKMLSVEQMVADAGKYGSLMFELPHQFDEILRGEEPLRASERRQQTQTHSTAAVTALMLSAGGIALITPQLSVVFEQSVWVSRFGFAVFVLCGIWLLRLIGRVG